MIPLDKFESYCPDEILDRGEAYYNEGLIYTFEALDPFRFAAIVVGTDPYAVSVELDEQKNITELNCTCPFDLGAICKHKVAVLHKVRDYKDEKLTSTDQHLTALSEKLEHMNKGELVDFIIHAASNNLDARQTLFSNAGVKDVWDPEVFWMGDI